MSLVHNERVKLSATALNNTAIATVVTGLIAPAASFAYGLSTGPSGHLWWLVASAWLSSGVLIHFAARAMLKGLRP
jgi:hypothetical protein